MNSTYNDFVSSNLDNTRLNKFMSSYYTTGASVNSKMVQDFFSSFQSFMTQSYSFVVETDHNALKYLLDDLTRKFMCQKYQNLRIVHVVNIPNQSPGFGFSFAKRDAYLVCSKSNACFGFQQKNFVEFSTYDMSQHCYTKLNRISMEDMESHKYSFDFMDYHFERPVSMKKNTEPTVSHFGGVVKKKHQVHNNQVKVLPVNNAGQS
jgi:hypothetical protein